MLVLFVVETNSQNESDKMYISKYLDVFYPKFKNLIKYDFVFLNGKGNYSKKSVLTKITAKQNNYLSFPSNVNERTEVIYCIDIDDLVDPFNKEYNKKVNDEIKVFCNAKGYKFVWFNRNIEDVFLGRLVSKSLKKKEAIKFFSHKLSTENFNKKNYESERLCENKYQTTNLGYVLNNVLKNENSENQ